MNKTNNKNPKQILNNHAQNYLPSNYRWWADYIFHFSHVTNIASILNLGKLLSVNKVNSLNSTTLNDNASAEVRNGTSRPVLDCVRFYFRPLTPTQFNNEGIRAKNEFSKYNAHCPVPIFLLFDSNMLNDSRVWFSEESLASHYQSHNIFQGSHNLDKAPFNEIYHVGPFDSTISNMIVKRRHAEVIVKDEFDLTYLKKIVCRTKAEAETLKNLLKSQATLNYADMICVPEEMSINSETIFLNKYLQITQVELTKEFLKVYLSQPCHYKRNLYIQISDTEDNFICSFSDKHYVFGFKLDFTANVNGLLDNRQIVKVEIFIDDNFVFSSVFKLI
ncbi:DarT ssDNA thymidine ADP-ribosyltransferase family protein [Lysinibacillus sp. FSL H8-0500]|uniref:DarT ssDNA thymidine ADP-ribosyltransferase family protein n=1 Tax=Lysinibacillus sp. FSL H8-0500 TaxID=2921393 RepID=UPI00310172CB